MTALHKGARVAACPKLVNLSSPIAVNDEYETFVLYLKLPSDAITRVKGKMHPKKSPQRRREWMITLEGN